MTLAVQDQLTNRFYDLDLPTVLMWAGIVLLAILVIRVVFRLARKFVGVAVVIVLILVLGGGSYSYFSGLFG